MTSKAVALKADAEILVDNLKEAMVEASGNPAVVRRIRAAFVVAVMETPEIMRCEPNSLRRELLKAAADNLAPDGKEAVILPYREKVKDERGNEAWVEAANYQPMVYGVIKRMREMGAAFNIVAEVVKERDTFHVNLADHEVTEHKYDQLASDRGEVVGAYCIIRDDQRRVIHREIMPRSEIDKVRNASKSKNSPAWTTWFEEMCKKAALRRASKYVTLNNERLSEMIERLDSMIDLSASPREVARADRANVFQQKQVAQSEPQQAATGRALAAEEVEAKAEIQAEREPIGIVIDDLQAYSDHLWGSRRTPADLKADSHQWKSTRWANMSAAGLRNEIVRIDDIHKARVTAKDAPVADDIARAALAEMGIESPEAEA